MPNIKWQEGSTFYEQATSGFKLPQDAADQLRVGRFVGLEEGLGQRLPKVALALQVGEGHHPLTGPEAVDKLHLFRAKAVVKAVVNLVNLVKLGLNGLDRDCNYTLFFSSLPLLPAFCLPGLLASHFRTNWLS